MTDDQPIRVQMTDRVWNGIYGCVDNAVVLAAEDCVPEELDDDPVVCVGTEIIEILSRPQRIAGTYDPSALDGMVSVTLRMHQWMFILDQGERDRPIYQQLGDEESLAIIRDARAAITTQLGIP